jgi:hypothetical protein
MGLQRLWIREGVCIASLEKGQPFDSLMRMGRLSLPEHSQIVRTIQSHGKREVSYRIHNTVGYIGNLISSLISTIPVVDDDICLVDLCRFDSPRPAKTILSHKCS